MLIDTHSRKIFQSEEFLEYANCPKCKLKTERKVDIMVHKRLFNSQIIDIKHLYILAYTQSYNTHRWVGMKNHLKYCIAISLL